jgi:hypothetical protein
MEKKKPEKIMNEATNLPALADWMMFGGGAVAALGLVLWAVRNRAKAPSGMAPTMAVLAIVVFLIGLVMVVHQGARDIGAMP